MEANDVVELWKTVAGDTRAAAWEDADLFGWFQRFRPSGAGVERAFSPLPLGKSVLERVMPIYAAAGNGMSLSGSSEGYFLPRAVGPIATGELLQLARRRLFNFAEIALAMGDRGLSDQLRSVEDIDVRDGTEERPMELQALEAAIYDVALDWVSTLSSVWEQSHVLREAFYSISCDYYLAYHLMWPWYASGAQLREPFEPEFELWRRGVKVRCLTPKRAVLYTRR